MAKESEAKKVVRKAAPRRPRKTATPKIIPHDHIAERAYYISLEGGGDAFENWLRAERELAST